ncbi:MAG: hypothetical protein HOH33_12550 [Verrucomicrobia bacterium]|nr:hypothetical protein [Verrucomicrobiota bacterium]
MWNVYGFTRFNKDIENIQLLNRLSESVHPAVIESTIHGLGHIADDFPKQCHPILERIIFKPNLPIELQDYAKRAIDGYIQ